MRKELLTVTIMGYTRTLAFPVDLFFSIALIAGTFDMMTYKKGMHPTAGTTSVSSTLHVWE
jgi:hypothetical protein